MSAELHNFLVQTVKERIEPNKLMKLKKEFDGVLQALSPVKRFGPRIYIGGVYEKRIDINTYADMDIHIYYPYDLQDHIREIAEYAFELVSKKFETRSLGLLYRITISEDYDIDFVSGRAEDPEYGYSLLYDPETNQRQTGKLKEQLDLIRNARSMLKLVKMWKRNKLLMWDSAKLEKSEMAYFLKRKDLNDYGIALQQWLLINMELKKKFAGQYEVQKFIGACEESLKAMKDNFWIRTIF
ncbi:MAG TPA: hypothetical protein PK079_04745 [Leptospiraceae bacterium]|nr:hypothetical protein [Leptospiraceae bacterium]HMW04966.1 hypothetical protein [Leptospiraceae bacterium]HMX31885.1 hypothetical protein [Leptospiraceae bacterium]HMY30813.1 hypothetical protein [Leptospiraceae bacterium]HMZ64274.1 hypothetical protein [Leptospiraceae bacterium]